ncbi:MAG: hypothetical protein LUI87_13035 [Lachnospiraceae bacterium]|nr:hypothetical protein [Lachnospiraceae bacterium]
MNAPEKKCDKVNASKTTGSRRPDIMGGTDSGRSDTSAWLIHMLCEISPSLLESEAEIPECDLEKVFTAGKAKEYGMSPQMEVMTASEAAFGTEPRRRPHSNWKLVVAASGLAAACSAAVTGIVVFVCIKHSASFN